jgi:hypothetical protein
MDNCTHLIFENLEGHKIEKAKPIALKRKIRFLRRAVRSIPALAPFKELILQLLTDSGKASEKRHAFIHGCIESQDGTILSVNKLDPSHPTYKVSEIKFDMRQFPALSEDLGHLVTEWIDLAQSLLLTLRRRKQIAKPPRRKARQSARTAKKVRSPNP